MPKQVAIIILTKNNPQLLKQCVDSIAKHTITTSYKIYVGDTGSDEVNININRANLAALFDIPTCAMYSLPEYHFAANNNDIVKHLVEEPYILFCNDDVELTENCIDPMYDWIVSNKHIGSVGCHLKFANGATQHAGQIAYVDSSGLLQCTHRGYGEYNKRHDTGAITGNTAAFMMTSKDSFDEIGGFDTQFTECWEDIQLNMKYIISGRINWYINEVSAIHHESQTRTRSTQAKYRLQYDYTYKLKPWFDALDTDKQQWILNFKTNK